MPIAPNQISLAQGVNAPPCRAARWNCALSLCAARGSFVGDEVREAQKDGDTDCAVICGTANRDMADDGP